jgi:hypothetical protein
MRYPLLLQMLQLQQETDKLLETRVKEKGGKEEEVGGRGYLLPLGLREVER